MTLTPLSGDQFNPHATAMDDLAEIQKLFADFSKDVVTKIDTVHMQLVDVNVRLFTIE